MDFESAAYERLQETTETILSPSGHFVSGVERLSSLFTHLSDRAMREHTASRKANSGASAISPAQAAECLTDHWRTKAFLRGLHAAICALQKRFPGEKISILYAGCGPFASLAIPLATQFACEEIEFHVVDLHPFSLANVQRLVEIFGLQNYFSAFICADATTWNPSFRPHIIVTETMDKALCYEPQASITANLADSICDGGLFLPERIGVDVVMTPSNADFPRRVIGHAVHLTRDSAASLNPDVRKKFPLPDVELHEPHDLLLQTSVDVFGPHQLSPGESRITEYILLESISSGSGTIEIRYRLGGLIGNIRKRVEQGIGIF